MNFIIDEKQKIISCSEDFPEGLEPISFFDSERLTLGEEKNKDEQKYQTEINGKKYDVKVKRIDSDNILLHYNITTGKEHFYENIYKEAIQAIATHKMVYDKKGRPVDYIFCDLNEEFKRQTGLGREIIGKRILEILPDTEEFWIKKYGDVVKTGRSDRFQHFSQALDKWFDVYVFKNQDHLFTTIFRDITEEKKLSDDLLYTKEFLTNIISSMPSMLIGIGADGKINEWNKRAAGLTGISHRQAVGKDISEVLRYEFIANALERCEEKRKVVKLDKVKGLIYGRESLIFEVLIYKLEDRIKDGYVLILRDITESIHLQEMMIQNEKMISVGGLAAGMAHEINNPISGILQGVQNIKRRLSPDNSKNLKSAERFGIDLFELTEFLEDRKVDVFLDGIEEAGFRAANIISNMLQFSRKTGGERKRIRIKDLVERVYQLACNEFDLSKKVDFRKITVDLSKVNDDLHIHCVDTEIEQVLLNLIINSAHAVFRHRPENGKINFITKRKDDKILIEVEDNGPGIDESLRSRIFEPFFTTKDPGEGTGLGLSVAYFIVKEHHGGEIYVSSRPDEGTRFTIMLPGGRKDDR